MSIYIVTNRKVSGRKILKSGSERAQPVFRVARYDIEGDNYELLPDAFLDKTREALSEDHSSPGSAQMFRALYSDMRLAQKGDRADVLFFIHGFGYDFGDSLEDIEQLYQLYVDTPDTPIRHLVYFSWPSVGDLLEYRDDQRDALTTGLVLGRLFRTVCEYLQETIAGDASARCKNRIHLMAHSMGNQVLENMMATLLQSSSAAPLLSEVLLLNSDIDWHAMEPGRPLHELPQYCRRVHIYTHESDDALLISDWTKNGRKRLGRNGPRDLRSIPSRTLVVDTSDVPPDSSTGLNERIVDHWGYRNRRVVMQDIRAVLRSEHSSQIPGRRLVDQSMYSLGGE